MATQKHNQALSELPVFPSSCESFPAMIRDARLHHDVDDLARDVEKLLDGFAGHMLGDIGICFGCAPRFASGRCMPP